jgi:hypothetical protein
MKKAYFGRIHLKKMARGLTFLKSKPCIYCGKQPKSTGSDYCGECIDNGNYLQLEKWGKDTWILNSKT